MERNKRRAFEKGLVRAANNNKYRNPGPNPIDPSDPLTRIDYETNRGFSRKY